MGRPTPGPSLNGGVRFVWVVSPRGVFGPLFRKGDRKMAFDINSVESVLGLLLGGGGLGALFTWKFTRRKLDAEASSSEVDLAQKVQETYQDMLEYKQKEVDDNHRLIEELRTDRDHYKQGYEELRSRQDKTDEIVRGLQDQVAENRKEMNMMRPFLCGVIGCKLRTVDGLNGLVGNDGLNEKTNKVQRKVKKTTK